MGSNIPSKLIDVVMEVLFIWEYKYAIKIIKYIQIWYTYYEVIFLFFEY